MMIKDNLKILFIGDSITAHERNFSDPNDLGTGFVMMASTWFGSSFPGKMVQFINRGINGDGIKDLKQRWDHDCIALKPDWVSILIGINDVWRRYTEGNPTTLEQFEEDYRALLQQVQKKLSAQIILCEPFMIPQSKEQEGWREDLDPKIELIHSLSQEYNTLLVKLDKTFAQMCDCQTASHWTVDGIHPTLAGHALIAQAWLDVVTES